MKLRLTVLFLSLLTIISCGTQKQVRNLQYQEVKNFRLAKLDLDRPEVSMDVQFFNPNSFGLTLKDAKIDLYINNAFIGSASLTRSFIVPGNDTFLLPVTLVPDFKNVFPNALQLLFNKEVNVRIQGSVKAGKGLFVTVPINYEGRQKLNVF
jgi:LEA14-like dessication related protein